MTTTIRVNGMTCGHCVAAVTSEVSKIEGVTDVAVTLDAGEVIITSESPVDEAVLRSAVDEAGYQYVGVSN